MTSRLPIRGFTIVLALALAGCGGDDPPAAEPLPTPSGSCGPGLAEAGTPDGDGLSAPDIATEVTAAVETEPVPNDGDAADDAAIWVNPVEPARSVVIGTDKRGGIGVYDLDGREWQYRRDGRMNNVDLRCDHPIAGEPATIVTAGNRSNNTIAVYRFDGALRRLFDVAAQPIHPDLDIYGSCMYRDGDSGRLYVFVTSQEGQVEQWELAATPQGRIAGEQVRTFALGSTVEGCVVDDTTGELYVAEEKVGIWKFAADPAGDLDQVLIARTEPRGELVADLEGLALLRFSPSAGYLLVSTQGDDSVAVLDLQEPHQHRGRFSIVDGAAVDGADNTDGIALAWADLGPPFSRGVFVAHDGENDDGNQNYKLVPLDSIFSALGR